MRKLQLAGGLAVPVLVTAVLACAGVARADVYDYGYGPVYGGSAVISGTTCPNGQCSGSYYTPLYSTTSYPIYSTQACPNGSCGLSGTCPNGSCGLRGQCAGGQCSGGQCSGGLCTSGQCPGGNCRSGRCGTCPKGDCERGNCSGNCPNGQCTTRYRGAIDSPSRRSSPSYDRPDYGYGAPDATSYRRDYSSERPQYRDYRDRDYRDESVSRRSVRSERRPTSRDSELESPFYN
jgi:hypothetical protein